MPQVAVRVLSLVFRTHSIGSGACQENGNPQTSFDNVDELSADSFILLIEARSRLLTQTLYWQTTIFIDLGSI